MCCVYLVFKCVQGLLSGPVFQTLPDPIVNGPDSQVKTVRTVTKPEGIKKKTTHMKFGFFMRPLQFCFINVQDAINAR